MSQTLLAISLEVDDVYGTVTIQPPAGKVWRFQELRWYMVHVNNGATGVQFVLYRTIISEGLQGLILQRAGIAPFPNQASFYEVFSADDVDWLWIHNDLALQLELEQNDAANVAAYQLALFGIEAD